MLSNFKSTSDFADLADNKPVRTWSLRSVLVTGLLLFSLIPAAIVGWLMYQSNLQSVDALSDKIVQDVAYRVQTDTENHLMQVHSLINALLPDKASETQIDEAKRLINHPDEFERTAFALTRMSPNVSFLYFGSAKGEFYGVQKTLGDPEQRAVVNVRAVGDDGRRFFSAMQPGDRTRELPRETKTYEPRGRPWYIAASAKKGRVFSTVYPSASSGQLLITLAQPVYDKDGSVLGIFAADLFLKRLAELLNTQKISKRGAALLVDEQGFLVATSTGDELFSSVDGKLVRRKPSDSINSTIRLGYAAIAPLLAKSQADPGQRPSLQQRVQVEGGESLIAAVSPFGESLGLKWTLMVAAPEGDFAEETRQAIKHSAFVMLSVLLAGGMLAALFAYSLSHRFSRLTQAAEQMGRGETPHVQAKTKITEVRTLSLAMRHSFEEIGRHRSEIDAHAQALSDANDNLEVRVARRTTELEASREEALSAARAKASFLATMSHEIRTPLNGVVGMTTLLADTPLTHEQQDYVHTMRVSSDQLLGVINDILDFSKIESGRLELEKEPLSVQAIIEEACDIAAPRAREKGLELLVDMGEQVPTWVRGDTTRLRQVLINYINNAIKFTEQGQVVVSAHVLQEFEPGQDALLQFRVKDTGIGIALDRQSALFQSFMQVDTSTTRKYGGTGLGLAICKRLAQLMGGAVGVDSAPGVGSTFWFSARLGYCDAPDHSPSSIIELASLNGKHAVVVDDTALNLRILDKQLKRWGMHTVLFERAQSALEYLAVNPTDIVITDMHMPEMDGQTFARTLRARHKSIPIVLLTSGTMPVGDDAKVFEARLLKPYRLSQFFNALTRIITGQAPSKPVAEEVAAAAKNMRILVADDNAINLKVAQAMLKRLGYESAIALNGREAVDMVSHALQPGSTPYAAILMDANMPVMDGFEAARLVLANHGQAAPPIIALTASVLEEDRQRCLDAGMQGFLPKPLRLDELAEALECFATVRPMGQAAVHSASALNGVPVGLPVAPENIAVNDLVTRTNGINTHVNAPLLMDWSRLEQFKEFDDEQGSMTREVIDLFIADTPTRVRDIQAAALAYDAPALHHAAHALKGAASNIGAAALTEACFVLEQACLLSAWPSDAAIQVLQLSELAKQTGDALRHWTF
jgi:signal transduction histidine kinase/DNA-binding response OmpR family regulator/HPt (histidine-containing phosphotransfer) domain-containing protein